MHQFFGFVLLSTIVAVGAEKTNINGLLDRLLEQMNHRKREIGAASVVLPDIPFGSKVNYSQAEFLGLDSLRRTADCWQEVKGQDVIFDLHYGFGLLTVVLPHLEIARTNMSAYARVRDNSVHISYTMHIAGEACSVKLNEIRVERMGNVEFGASRPEYDGSNVDGFFRSYVMPTLNWILQVNFVKIEASMQALCEMRGFQT